MEYKKGMVSVVIPTYKRSEMLGRAIKSVINQTYTNLEVLVVSDNEPDDEYSQSAENTVESFNDERIHFITQEHHKNGAAARNAGIRAAVGEYIAFLDDDDYWELRKLELQINLLDSLGYDWGGVTCKNKHYVAGKLVAALPKMKDGDMCKAILARLSDVSTDTILLRRKALDETGYFNENLKRHQEIQLMTFFTSKYKLKLLNMYLVYVDSEKNENQPSPERMEMIKKDFFTAVDPVLKTFSCGTIRNIKRMHNFELGMLYIRSGQKKTGIKKCLCVFANPVSFFYAVRYILKKINCKLWAKLRVKCDAYTKLQKVRIE